MFAENIKIQNHVQQIKDNVSTSAHARKQLVRYGFVALIYCTLNVYLGLRGWQAFGSQMNMPLYVVLLAALALVLPIAAYLLDQGSVARVLPRIIAYAGFYWIAFFLYAVIMMAGLDFVRILNYFSRQQLFRLVQFGFPFSLRFAVYLIIMLTLLLLAVGTLLARKPRITGFLLKVDKVLPRSRPLRIAMLSDIHYGSLVSTANLSLLCERVQAQQPDLILLAGDLIDNSLQLIRQTDFLTQMSRLRAPLGVFAVLGNHELINADRAETVNFYRAANIRVLLDETVVLDNQLVLAGRNERHTEFSGQLEQQSPEHLLDGVDKNLPILLMQHQPADLPLLSQAGVDLALAGHTHRGQLFPLNFLNRSLFTQTRRYHRLGGLQSIISAGYGTWGPPIRLGSRSEIVIIDLTGRQSA